VNATTYHPSAAARLVNSKHPRRLLGTFALPGCTRPPAEVWLSVDEFGLYEVRGYGPDRDPPGVRMTRPYPSDTLSEIKEQCRDACNEGCVFNWHDERPARTDPLKLHSDTPHTQPHLFAPRVDSQLQRETDAEQKRRTEEATKDRETAALFGGIK